MESGNSPNSDSPNPPAPSLTGCLSEAEREALRQRAAEARAAAARSIERYLTLLAHSRHRVNVTTQRLATVEGTRALLRESVERYAHLMKALEIPPERVLSLVKQTLKEQVPHPEESDETKLLIDNVITWCIRAYYFTSPAA